MSLTPDQLQRIALLARIAVGAEEVRGVTDRLNRVLGLIDQLQARRYPRASSPCRTPWTRI